jgi:hypothetical protein
MDQIPYSNSSSSCNDAALVIIIGSCDVIMLKGLSTTQHVVAVVVVTTKAAICLYPNCVVTVGLVPIPWVVWTKVLSVVCLGLCISEPVVMLVCGGVNLRLFAPTVRYSCSEG